MDGEILQDLAESFRLIAQSLAGLHEIEKNRFAKEYPARQPREAVVSRVSTEEDINREKVAGTERTIREWLEPPSPGEPEEDEERWMGERERAFRAAERAGLIPDAPIQPPPSAAGTPDETPSGDEAHRSEA